MSEISDTISEADRHLDTISECMTEAPLYGGSKSSTPMSQTSTTSSSISAVFKCEVPAELEVEEVGPLLGSGSFGKVYRVAMADGREAAMKVVSCRKLGEAAIQDQVREVELASKLRHPNVVSTFTYGMAYPDLPGGKTLHIFCTQEICELGTLTMAAERGWLRQERSLDLSPDMRVVWRALLDVANAMAYVHSNNVIHADLTGRNVLLSVSADRDCGFQAKVCDFGLARSPCGHSFATKVLGTITHMAPELIRIDKPELTYESDVWAFGVVSWEAYHGKCAYKGKNAAQICVAVARNKQLGWPADAPESFLALMKDCLLFEYSRRPSFAAVGQRLEVLMEATPAPADATPAPTEAQ
jgi:serine/threonine protein kinase